jgi:hypothetical protein
MALASREKYQALLAIIDHKFIVHRGEDDKYHNIDISIAKNGRKYHLPGSASRRNCLKERRA